MLQIQASRSTATHTCSPLNPTPQNQFSQPIVMHSCPSSLHSSIQNQVSRSNTIPISSTATNFISPNGAKLGRLQESGSTLVRRRYQLPFVSFPRQLLGVHNHAIQRERGRGSSSSGPQFLHYHMMSKGLGRVGSTLTVNDSVHGWSGFRNLVNLAQQYKQYHSATGFSNDRTCNGQNDVWLPKNLSSYPHPGSELACQKCFSQPLSQSNDSHNVYESCIQGNDAPSSYVACLSSNWHENEHQIRSENENACGNITECGIASQDTCQQKPHEESLGESARVADFDSSLAENTGQNIEHLIESSNLRSSGSINHPPNVKESGARFTGSTNLGSIDDLQNWLFDRETVSVVADGALASELNVPSPDPDLSPIDTSMLLFDFETSCNGLAHA